jgi:hypothetical protein
MLPRNARQTVGHSKVATRSLLPLEVWWRACATDLTSSGKPIFCTRPAMFLFAARQRSLDDASIMPFILRP